MFVTYLDVRTWVWISVKVQLLELIGMWCYALMFYPLFFASIKCETILILPFFCSLCEYQSVSWCFYISFRSFLIQWLSEMMMVDGGRWATGGGERGKSETERCQSIMASGDAIVMVVKLSDAWRPMTVAVGFIHWQSQRRSTESSSNPRFCILMF